MDDGGAGAPGEDAGRDQCGGETPGHRLGLLVDEEHPVGVTVEGEADVGLLAEHGRPEVLEVLDLDGVGGMVGEAAVELEVERHQPDRQAPEQRRHHLARHPVGGVDHDGQRLDVLRLDEGEHMGGEVLDHVQVLDGAPRPGWGQFGLREPPDVGETRVLPDGGGARQAHLDAVVAGRVVGGGEHCPGGVQLAGGKVERIAGDLADVNHAGTLPRGPLGEGGGQRGRGEPHVPAHDDLRSLHEGSECGSESLCDRFVDIVWIDAPDVVGLEDAGEIRQAHVAHFTRGWPPPAAGGHEFEQVLTCLDNG